MAGSFGPTSAREDRAEARLVRPQAATSGRRPPVLLNQAWGGRGGLGLACLGAASGLAQLASPFQPRSHFLSWFLVT